MDAEQYKILAMRTNDGKATERLTHLIDESELPFPEVFCNMGDALNACLGLSGEVGELNDMIKKWIFHEKKLDVDHLKKEMGDIFWYCALMCQAFDWSIDEILAMNITKLMNRYPMDEGFTVNRANNRAENDV